MSAARDGGWTVAGLLWATAYAAVGLGSLTLSADRSSLAALVAVGLALWAVALLVDGPATADPHGRRVVWLVLGVALATEAAGLVAAIGAGEPGQALWFGLAASFAAAGMIGAGRSDPGDDAFAAQLLFHVLMGLPVLGYLARPLSVVLAGPVAAATGDGPAPLARTLGVVTGVGLPLLGVGLLGALVLDRLRNRHGRAWSALLVAEAAYVVAACRWAGDGL